MKKFKRSSAPSKVFKVKKTYALSLYFGIPGAGKTTFLRHGWQNRI